MDNQYSWVQSDEAEKRSFKKPLYHLFGGLLIYEGILYAVVIAVIIAVVVFFAVLSAITSGKFSYEDTMDKLMETDCGMILGVTAGCVFMALFFMKRLTLPKIFTRRSKMTPTAFVILLTLLMSVQLPFAIFDEIIETLLNMIGLSAQASIEASQAGSTTISMMLYAGFIGPVAEEITYRGFTMMTLEKMNCGKGYAVLVSSVIFGVMHANLTQSIYAFFAGLVFAYAAMEFGIKWSIALHIANNFFFGDVLSFISDRIPELAANILNYGMLIAFFIGGLIVLIVKRKAVVGYVKENYHTPSKYYMWTFSNPLLIIYIAINMLFALLGLSKL